MDSEAGAWEMLDEMGNSLVDFLNHRQIITGAVIQSYEAGSVRQPNI